LQPGRINGAKRLIVLLPLAMRANASPEWIEAADEHATLMWQNGLLPMCSEDEAGLTSSPGS
jgi:hypothetical protein